MEWYFHHPEICGMYLLIQLTLYSMPQGVFLPWFPSLSKKLFLCLTRRMLLLFAWITWGRRRSYWLHKWQHRSQFRKALVALALVHPYLDKYWNLYKPVPWLQLIQWDFKIRLNVLSGNVSLYKWGKRKMCHESNCLIWLQKFKPHWYPLSRSDILMDPQYDLIISK